MDCRAFEKHVEDYLQDGLDYPARFSMERHAHQCIACGRVLTNALRLRQMAKEIERVKAPADFESAVIKEIAKQRLYLRNKLSRRFWLTGIQRRLTMNWALVTVGAFLIGAVTFYLYRHYAATAAPAASVAIVTPEVINPESEQSMAPKPSVSEPVRVEEVAARQPAAKPRARVEELIIPEKEVPDADYVEHIVAGPDNRPMRVRLPKAIHVQFGQASEEYFIRNVSH